MTWLDRKIDRILREQSLKLSTLIQAGILFNVVWDELTKIIDEANDKGFILDSKAKKVTVRHHRFRLEGIVPYASVEISLSKARNRLIASGNIRKQIAFDIDVCEEDRVVCLKLNHRRVTPQEAAETILDALLFN